MLSQGVARSAVSTLVTAALFNPLRRRIQHRVDRRFNRACYNAEATLAALATRLREAVDLETVQATLIEMVNRSVALSHSSV